MVRRVTLATSARSRAGTCATGVAVMTSSPKTASTASSRAATYGPSAATTGALAIQPSQPPPFCIAAPPSAGTGVPWATCHSPQLASTSAPQPMTMRPVAALCPGWRRIRQARAASSSGTVQSSQPVAPVTTARRMPPTVPGTSHQVAAATTIAPARKSSPSPSRRTAGSSSPARARAP